jgi:hypothetical protein
MHLRKFDVMRGLAPRIHDELHCAHALRKSEFIAQLHGLPGQARQ